MTPAALDLEIVGPGPRFDAAVRPWAALWARADGSIFQSHGWIAAWWGALPPSGRPTPRIALAWRAGELVGVLPLVVRRYRGLRVLEWAAKDVTDYCDALVAPGPDRGEIVAALWATITQEGGWDVAYLSHLAPGSAFGELQGASGEGGAALRPGTRTAMSLRVPAPAASAQPWFESLSKKARQNYRRAGATLAEMGVPAAFRVVKPGEPVDAILTRLIELKAGWLQRTGRSSPLLEHGGAMLHSLVAALAQAGTLRLFVLEGPDGQLLAGTVNFVEHGRLRAFFTTYDPAYEKASVGMVILVDGARWTFEQGFCEVDFMCGDEDFKRRFAGTSVTLTSRVAARTLLGRAALAADRLATAFRERRAKAAMPASSARNAPSVAAT